MARSRCWMWPADGSGGSRGGGGRGPRPVPGPTAPAARERGRLVLPARPSQPGIAAVEVDTHMVAEKTPDDSTIHLRVGPQRRVKLIQVAENLVLELDEASEIAGFWLLQVPAFPHVEEGF